MSSALDGGSLRQNSQQGLRIVQFDENLDDDRFVNGCNAEGLALAYRMPRDWRRSAKKDPEVLSRFARPGTVLFTNDRGIASQHTTSLTHRHGGIVIIADEQSLPRTMTTIRAQKIVSEFKKAFPDWHAIGTENSVVEIQPGVICVWHIDNGDLVRTGHVLRDNPNWTVALRGLLEQNASRDTPELPGQICGGV